MIEMLVTMSLVAIVAAIALPHLDSRRMDTNEILESIVGDLRMARLRAITGGVHYALSVGGEGTGYQVVAMEDAGNGNWVEAAYGWKKDVPIPSTVSVAGDDGAFSLEFNTRGMLVDSEQPVAVTITDDFGAVRHFTVWPSGQVHVE